MKKEKTILVGSKEDRVFCRCGEKMKPVILSHLVQYRCSMMSWFNFMKHSLPKPFIRKKDKISFTIETSLEGVKEIAKGLKGILKTGELTKGDIIQFNHKNKTLFDIKFIKGEKRPQKKNSSKFNQK